MRPTKLTDEAAAKILEALAQGSPRKYAAAAAGVGASTMRTWMASPRPEHRAFQAEVKKAEAASVAARVARIESAGKAGTWQADAWMLERRHPTEFGRDSHLVAELKRLVRGLKRREQAPQADRRPSPRPFRPDDSPPPADAGTVA